MKTTTLTIFGNIEVDIAYSVCVDCSQDGPYIEDWRIVTLWDDNGENDVAQIEALHRRIEENESERDRIELELLDLVAYDLDDYSSEGDYRYAMQHGR